MKESPEQCPNYTSILRVISGQQTEPEFVLVEHSYARSWNWNPGTFGNHPRKTLFLSVYPKNQKSDSDEIDVVEKDPEPDLPYDLAKGKRLMNECAWHISPKSPNIEDAKDFSVEDTEEEDWTENVDRTNWTDAQLSLFSHVLKIFDDDKLGRLALKNVHNEPVKRRAHLDKSAARFRQALGRINWDLKLTQWLHIQLIQNMSKGYLAAYLDILQTLRSKIPTLIDKMVALSSIQKGSTLEALNLLLKRPWDPALPSLNQSKPQKLESLPIIIQVPSGPKTPTVPQVSRRSRFFNAQLQHLVKSFPICITAESMDAGSILEKIVSEVRTKITDCKSHYPGQPIVLLGWGIGAVLASFISLVEKVSAIICLGFPINTSTGKRGEADDPLLESKTPTLFLIGDRATDCSVDELEDIRHRMPTETSLVIISEADNLLRMSWEKRYSSGLTQSMVDRCIVDEIGEFLTHVLSEGPQVSSASSNISSHVHSAAFAVPPKAFQRGNLSNKRKLNSTVEVLNAPSSKVFRAGTNLSQTLGLKIPVGVSNYSSTQASENSPTASGRSIPSSSPHPNFGGETVALSEPLCGSQPQFIAESSKSSKSTQNELVGLSDANRSTESSLSNPLESSNLSQSFMGSSSGVATISLGSIASISHQKYQRMFENSKPKKTAGEESESVKKIGSSQANRPALASDIASEVSIFDDASEGTKWQNKPTSRRSTESSQILVTSSLMTSKPNSGAPVSKGNVALPVSTPIPAPSTSTPPITKWHKRGRPPNSKKHLGAGRGATSTSGTGSTRGRGRGQSYSRGTGLNGRKRNEGVHSRAGAVAPTRASRGEASMAVLTLTGNGGDGGGVEIAAEGISSLGRGFLTLSKGGTSTVRVFSANSSKLSTASITTSPHSPSSNNSRSAIKGSPAPSFVFTNISSVAQTDSPSPGPSVVSKTGAQSLFSLGNFVLAGKRERVISADSKTIRSVLSQTKKAVITPTIASLSNATQPPLNIQGISASRGISAAKIIPTTRSLGTLKPTMMLLSSTPSEITSPVSFVSSPPVSLVSSTGDKGLSIIESGHHLNVVDNASGALKDPSAGGNPIFSLTPTLELPLSLSENLVQHGSTQTPKDETLIIDAAASEEAPSSTAIETIEKPNIQIMPIDNPNQPNTAGVASSAKDQKTSPTARTAEERNERNEVIANVQLQKNVSRIRCISSSLSKEVVASNASKPSANVHAVVIPPTLKENKPDISTASVSSLSALRLIKSITPIVKTSTQGGSFPHPPTTNSNIITKTFTITSGNLGSVKTGYRRISLDDLRLKEKKIPKTFDSSSEKESDARTSFTSTSTTASSAGDSLSDYGTNLFQGESSAVVTLSTSIQTPIVTSKESKMSLGELGSEVKKITHSADESFEIDVEGIQDSPSEDLPPTGDAVIPGSVESTGSASLENNESEAPPSKDASHAPANSSISVFLSKESPQKLFRAGRSADAKDDASSVRVTRSTSSKSPMKLGKRRNLRSSL